MVETCIFIVTWHKRTETYLLLSSVQELNLTQHASKHTDSCWFHCTRTADIATNEQLASQDILFLSPKKQGSGSSSCSDMSVFFTDWVYLILDQAMREEIYENQMIFSDSIFQKWFFLVFLSSSSSLPMAILGCLIDGLDRGVFLQWRRR